MRSVLLLVSVAACGTSAGEYSVPLAYYTSLHVMASDQSVAVILGDAIPGVQSGPCPIVSADLTGQWAGMALPLISRGGKVGDSPGDDVSDNECDVPGFRIDQPPPAGPVAVSLSDAALTITCELPDLVAARAIATASWDWQVGQRVVLDWSPAGDLARWTSATVTIYRRDATGAIDDSFNATGVTVAGDTLAFTVPAFRADATNTYFVQASPSGRVACVATTGAAGTTVASSVTMFGATHDVTLAP